MTAIPSRDGERITKAILALRTGLTGDIKRLTNFTPEYRLRVGDWRVLFEMRRARSRFIVFFIDGKPTEIENL